MNTTIYKFNTKAEDNFGYEYSVSLIEGKYGNILKIEATCGQWYTHTLREDEDHRGPYTKLAIDLGANWFVINFDEIMDELKAFEEAN